ncbi:integrase [Sinorhizobium meliloti]|nr:integrase [Sinorhizobium meliloti]
MLGWPPSPRSCPHRPEDALLAFGASAAAPCMGDVRRAIGAIGATTSVDIRDRAILLLLATTGIRNGELRAIRLRDIDWRTGEVFVRRTKGKRDRVVPLLEETGAALADYILRARPKVDSPYLLLSFTPPVGPFKFAAPISRIVRKRLRHVGVELGRVAGAHLLRHSLATQLVGQRRPINEIADLLGHRSINTTALYVKVATSQLAEVALLSREARHDRLCPIPRREG